ncbi:hypothetical protein FACS189441_4080 [Betaproteobacteria bacterium]|nr:hypothetical protein FACS189441_4080 [Betaproteobacteria bacterium]
MSERTAMQKLARYETAQEALGLMVAMRSSWIARERDKPNPDTVKIEQWRSEQYEYGFAEEDLSLDDEAEIERVLATYSPLIRANFERLAKEIAATPKSGKAEESPKPGQEITG